MLVRGTFGVPDAKIGRAAGVLQFVVFFKNVLEFGSEL